MPGVWELIIILAIVLLIFGGKRLKNLGGDLGSAIKGFKKSVKDENVKKSTTDDDIIDVKVADKEKTSK